jgi:hypothetical protein
LRVLKYSSIKNILVVKPNENPDILFYSIFGSEHQKYTNIRKIFYSGEPFPPRNDADFNLTFDKTDIDINNFRYPLWLSYTNDYLIEECNRRKYGTINVPKRTKFCSFISNGECKTTCRREIVEKLSKYKRVDCGGKYLNNIGYTVPRGTNCSGKIEHNLNYKFAIAFENEDYPGYVTEKICDIYKSNCIPIYWGNKEVLEDFNPKTFIYAKDFENFDELVEYIIKVDNDDELYASYFKEPFFSNMWLDMLNDPYKTFYKNLSDLIVGKYSNLLDNYFQLNNSSINKNICFIHSCNLKDKGLKRLEYLIKKINETKLINTLEKIYINNIGIPIENKYGEKYDICNYSTNIKLVEFPTINKLLQFSQYNPNYNILYLHTKGILHDDNNKCINDWIDMMVYFLINNYETCISKLHNGFQVVGCNHNLWNARPHFSGNFWWASSNYLKNIPLLKSDDSNNFNNRWDAEFWIYQNKPKIFEMHNSRTCHYTNEYPMQRYHKQNDIIWGGSLGYRVMWCMSRRTCGNYRQNDISWSE